MTIEVRTADPARDARAVATIYADHALHGTATFDEAPIAAGAFAARMTATLARGWPWLIAEEGGEAVGYAYAAILRDRGAYRHACEDSIYVRADRTGRGVGRALMTALIDQAEQAGFRQMVAIIGDSANAASIGLHAAFGFRHIGTLTDVGLKFGRWLDVVYMQRGLGAHSG